MGFTRLKYELAGAFRLMKTAWRPFLLLSLAAAALLLGATYILDLHPTSSTPKKVLASHPPILVLDASELTRPGAGTGCECIDGGSGGSSDPFIISGWKLNASEGDAISIAGTTVHILIANVVVNGSGRYAGVLLQGVENAVVMDSSFSRGFDGVALYSSSNILIANNTLVDNSFGIVLEGSNNNTVTRNTVERSGQVAIFVRGSSNIVDANLVLDGSFGGINVDGTAGLGSSNRITNNTVKGNSDYGVGLWSAGNNIVKENLVSENRGAGIMLLDSSATNVVEDNHVFNNVGDGVLIADQSSGNRVARNNVTGNGDGVTTFDLHEESLDNVWASNTFNTKEPDTIG